jgi:hypothetical protein
MPTTTPLDKLRVATNLCLENGLMMPALMLLYATIDCMAWLDRDLSHDDVKRDDFLRWVDRHLLPNGAIPCTAIDLYAARCAILHSYTAESLLSRQGQARQIWYAWGRDYKASDLQPAIDALGGVKAIALHVETLGVEIWKGIDAFLDEAELALATPRGKLISERLKQWLSEVRP